MMCDRTDFVRWISMELLAFLRTLVHAASVMFSGFSPSSALSKSCCISTLFIILCQSLKSSLSSKGFYAGP
ncbi:hypothetical protein EV1_009128 [Malus domestica]